MEMVFLFIVIELTKSNGKMIKWLEKAKYVLQMAQSMMVKQQNVKGTDMVHLQTLKEINTLANGRMIRKTGKDYLLTKKITNIKEVGTMIK